MNNSLKKNICQKLVYDIKQHYYDTSDNMIRIMQYFSNNNINDLEKKTNDDVSFLYTLLGWDNENYYDVMYSFWQIFTYGLVHVNPNHYFITSSGNIKNAYKEHNYKYNYNSYPEKFLSNEELELKKDNLLLQQKFPSITTLAAITHSVSNFVPVPDNIFNFVKNSCGVGDYLPLMINKIEYCIEKVIPLKYEYNTKEVTIKKLQEWKDYFITNASHFSLELEFEYNNHTGKMKGNLLFDTQSFDKPLPIESSEYEQCLESTIMHILSRCDKMAKKLTT